MLCVFISFKKDFAAICLVDIDIGTTCRRIEGIFISNPGAGR